MLGKIKNVLLLNLSARTNRIITYSLLFSLIGVSLHHAYLSKRSEAQLRGLEAAVPAIAAQVYLLSCMRSVAEISSVVESQGGPGLQIDPQELSGYCRARAGALYQQLTSGIKHNGKPADGEEAGR